MQNQFGPQKLTVTDPILLGVPSQKDTEPPPSGLDHFKCYQATGNPVNAVVDLIDQFHFEPGVAVLNPDWFCNPTEKIHNGQDFPITDPVDHLVCYLINPQPPFRCRPERDQPVRQRELRREPGGSPVRAESEAGLHHPDAGPHRHAGSDALFRRDLPDADSSHRILACLTPFTPTPAPDAVRPGRLHADADPVSNFRLRYAPAPALTPAPTST